MPWYRCSYRYILIHKGPCLSGFNDTRIFISGLTLHETVQAGADSVSVTLAHLHSVTLKQIISAHTLEAQLMPLNIR